MDMSMLEDRADSEKFVSERYFEYQSSGLKTMILVEFVKDFGSQSASKLKTEMEELFGCTLEPA